MSDTPKSTLRDAPEDPANASRRSLLIIGDGVCTTHPLPAEGEVVIGREPAADVVIDDPSISRRHALLRMGPITTIEDLGSANGSRVRDSWLKPGKPVAVARGEVIDIGGAMIILQDRAPTLRQRRLWSHDDFESRLEEECARAVRNSSSFAVAQIVASTVGGAQLREALDEAIRAGDVVARHGTDAYEVLFVDVDDAEAERARGRLDAALGAHGIEALIGIARYPRDGRDPYTLIAHASAAARTKDDPTTPPGGVADRAMQTLDRLVRRVAAGNISVLILGETGVGKEVLAEKLHRLSARSDQPFLRLNCAALSESLLESELFGHERGAFTGAVQAKPGLLETAQGGTVFLDEVGELPMSTQVKLLRVIEEREVLRVGGLKARPIDVRFVAATNRDLELAVTVGRFRQDLYFRLNGVTLVIPPLRQRVGEIEVLARTFVSHFCAEDGRPEPALSPEAIAVLEAYSWPGNIRELRNVIERAVLICSEATIQLDHLPIEKMRDLTTPIDEIAMPVTDVELDVRRPPPATAPATAARDGLRDELADLERRRILQALEQCGGNQTRAAQILGIARRTLVNRLNVYGLPRPRKHPG